MDPTVVSVVTTTRTGELTSNLIDPNLLNAVLFHKEPKSKSERKKKGVSSLTPKRLMSSKCLKQSSIGIPRPSRDTPTPTRKIRSVFPRSQ